MLDVLADLQALGAVYLDKHFVYTSGKHGSGYINMDPLFPNIQLIWELSGRLAGPFLDEFETIAAPATGAIVLAVLAGWTTYHEGYPEVGVVWADRKGDDFAFERAGFADHLKDKRVLVVEDLLTTGGSVIKTCRAAEKLGADVIGVSTICNRGGVTAEQLGVPRLEALTEVNFAAVNAEECQLCRDGVPIVEDIGHGADYKASHPDYVGGFTKLLG